MPVKWILLSWTVEDIGIFKSNGSEYLKLGIHDLQLELHTFLQCQYPCIGTLSYMASQILTLEDDPVPWFYSL